LKQSAVDVREPVQVLVQCGRTIGYRCVKDLEQLCQPRTQVSAISACALHDELIEYVARLENAGIVSKEAENYPDKKALQVMSMVTSRLELVMESADKLGSLDVGWVLIAEDSGLNAENKAEHLNVGAQLIKRKGLHRPFAKIMKLERLKITDQNVPRALAFWKRIKILSGLAIGLLKGDVPDSVG